MLEPFQMLAPATVADALDDLKRERAHLYAGGVELSILLSSGALSADYLIDIKRIPGLTGIAFDGDALRVGAATTHQEIADHPDARRAAPLLAQAAGTLGNIRVRHQGTIGGNVSLRYSHSDLLPPLLVHEARVELNGDHELALTEFLGRGGEQPAPNDLLRGTAERVGGPPALVTAVIVPALGQGWRHAAIRSERLFRPPTLNVAVALRLRQGWIKEARVAVGCALPYARRLTALERHLAGRAHVDVPAQLAGGALELVDDLAGSAEYKAHVATVLVRRALEQAMGG